MDKPPPLAGPTLDGFLHYLIPPVQPLPPALLSLPTLQRHHFLKITPDDLTNYLTWPSPDQSTVLDILHTLPIPGPAQDLPIKYSGDQETLFAHINIRSSADKSSEPELRIVFQWDPLDNAWKYHNLALMPFLPNSYDFIDDVWGQNDAVHVVEPVNEDDAYWEAYGQDDRDERDADAHLSKPDAGNSEDAYWAQYATVHGSGDSTIPSPVPEKRKSTALVSSQKETNDQNVPVLRSNKHAVDLSDRLHALSSRLQSFPFQDDVPELTEESNSEMDSPMQTPEVEGRPFHATAKVAVEEPLMNHAAPEANAPLKDAIRGVYILWKMSQPSTCDKGSRDDEFLDIVKQAIQDS